MYSYLNFLKNSLKIWVRIRRRFTVLFAAQESWGLNLHQDGSEVKNEQSMLERSRLMCC
jgi:hypothetical protein